MGKTTRPLRYDLNQIDYDYTVEVRNRFKGLDLIDRVPDELWRFMTLYTRQGLREAKIKGENGRYTHLNAEFQRIARRDKKAFHSNQCKEIEKNNRLGKTRDLFKNIRDTEGIFHAKIDSIKDRNGMDLTEEEDIKKRWQEYTDQRSDQSLSHVRLFATP